MPPAPSNFAHVKPNPLERKSHATGEASCWKDWPTTATRPFSAPAETSGNWLNPSRRREILPLTRIQFKPRHHSAVLHLELPASRPEEAGHPPPQPRERKS